MPTLDAALRKLEVLQWTREPVDHDPWEIDELWTRRHADGVVEAVAFLWSPLIGVKRPGVLATYVRGKVSSRSKYDVKCQTEEISLEVARLRYLGKTN